MREEEGSDTSDDDYVETDKGDSSLDDELPSDVCDDAADGTESAHSEDSDGDEGMDDDEGEEDAAAGAAAAAGRTADFRVSRRAMQAASLRAMRDMIANQNRLILALQNQQQNAAAAPAPVPAPAPAAAAPGGSDAVPLPIEQLGLPNPRTAKGFDSFRKLILVRCVKSLFHKYLGNTTKNYNLRPVAEDACAVMAYNNPGDLAVMMQRMKRALKAVARAAASEVAVKARDQFILLHPDLGERLPKAHFRYEQRLQEHVSAFATLIDVVGGPTGGFDLNGADRNHWAFCSKVQDGKLYFANATFLKWQDDFLMLMPAPCRRWSFYYY